jgi:hypothetical protein
MIKKFKQRDAAGIWETDDISITCNAESEFLIIEIVISQK